MQVTQTAMTQIQQIAATFADDIPNLNGLDIVRRRQHRGPGQRRAAAGRRPAEHPGRQQLCVCRPGQQPIRRSRPATTSCPRASTPRSTPPWPGCRPTGRPRPPRRRWRSPASNATGTSPFSAYLSQPAASISAPVVQTGEGGTVQTGLLASANSVAVSSGTRTPTTGSYMRDLMMRAGDAGVAVQFPDQRSGFAAPRAEHRHQPERRGECDGNRCRRAWQHPVQPHGHADPVVGHRDGADRPVVIRAGRRHGADDCPS